MKAAGAAAHDGAAAHHGHDDALYLAMSSRLQVAERHVVGVTRERDVAQARLDDAAAQHVYWKAKAEEMRAQLIGAGIKPPEFTPPAATAPSIDQYQQHQQHQQNQHHAIPHAIDTDASLSTLRGGAHNHNPQQPSQPSLTPRITYEAPVVLPFSDDSPYSRRSTIAQRRKVEMLGRRLKLIIDRARDFSAITSKFVQSASELSSALSQDWDDVENGIDRAHLTPSTSGGDSASSHDHASSKSTSSKSTSSKNTSSSSSSSSSSSPSQIHDPLCLSSSMSKLGSMLTALSDITSNLRVSVDAFLCNSLLDFRSRYVVQCLDSAAATDRACDEYENAVARRLSRKKKDLGPVSKLPSSIGPASPITDPVAAAAAAAAAASRGKATPKELQLEDDARKELSAVVSTRRQFELARFDHIQMLNEVLTERRLELVEMVSASYLAFITFFNEGAHIADNLKTQVDFMNVHMHCKRPLYVIDRKRIQQERKLLDTALLTMTLPLSVSVSRALRPISSSSSSSSSTSSSSSSTTPSREPVRAMIRGKSVPIEKDGYLRKQSSSLKKDWKRRWFSLQQGQLFYVRDADDVSPVHVVNVLLCTVRPSAKSELDLCFDLISPNKRVYTLQAESEEDKQEWMEVFQNCVEVMLSSSNTMMTSSEKNMSDEHRKKQQDQKEVAIDSLKKLNSVCVDCDAVDPDWASINLGVMMCIDCSGVHRSLGAHVSKVRSLSLDSWTQELLDMMLAIGNRKYNEIYEGALPEDFKPTPTATRDQREEYISLKHQRRAFLSKSILTRELESSQLVRQFFAGVEAENLIELLSLLALQVDIDDGIVNEELAAQYKIREAEMAERAAKLEQEEIEREELEERRRIEQEMQRLQEQEAAIAVGVLLPSPPPMLSPSRGSLSGGAAGGAGAAAASTGSSTSPAPSPTSAAASLPESHSGTGSSLTTSGGGGGGAGVGAGAGAGGSPSPPLRRMTRALHLAARLDKLLALEFLIQNNARDDAPDELGRTALQVATELNQTRAQQRLLRVGKRV